MICQNCGTEIKEGDRFCKKCGMPTKKNKGLLPRIAAGAVVLAVIAAVSGFLLYRNSDTVKIRQQLELAQRYLLEEEYDLAIEAYEAVIEIDPGNENAYLGIAETYAAADDLENAAEILEKASKQVASEKIAAQLEEYTSVMEQRRQAAAEERQAAADRIREMAGERQAAADKVCETAEETPDSQSQEAWRQAYIDLVNQYEAGQYEFEHENTYKEIEEYDIEGCGYSLINLDNKGVPELVIKTYAPVLGVITWLYTYDNDTLYKMAELYSGMHNYYEYIDGEGIVVSKSVDGAGAMYYYSYYQIDSNNQLVHMYDETLHANGEPDDVHYYYGDTQITEEEYEAYFEERQYDYLEGCSSSSEIINEINTR